MKEGYAQQDDVEEIEEEEKEEEEDGLKINGDSDKSSPQNVNGIIGTKIKITAHRGNGPTSKFSGFPNNDVPAKYAPENTIMGFKEGILQGCNGIELDICLSKDDIPMVIHDDLLNANVVGVDRKENDLGKVTELTVNQLQEIDISTRMPKFNVGRGEKIPTLIEVIKLIASCNRGKKSSDRLFINIELKYANTAKRVWEVIDDAIKGGLVSHKDIIYCSFEHNELKTIRNWDMLHYNKPLSQITPAFQTKWLFGEENVKKPGWRVNPYLKYKTEILTELTSLQEDLEPSGFDAVVYDIDPELVEFCKKNDLSIHASTSDVRDANELRIIVGWLLRIKGVEVYFKTDEPRIVRELITEIITEMQHNEGIDMLSSRICKIEEIPGTNLVGTRLRRVPKPAQQESLDDLLKIKVMVCFSFWLSNSALLRWCFKGKEYAPISIIGFPLLILIFRCLYLYVGKQCSEKMDNCMNALDAKLYDNVVVGKMVLGDSLWRLSSSLCFFLGSWLSCSYFKDKFAPVLLLPILPFIPFLSYLICQHKDVKRYIDDINDEIKNNSFFDHLWTTSMLCGASLLVLGDPLFCSRFSYSIVLPALITSFATEKCLPERFCSWEERLKSGIKKIISPEL